MRAAPIAFVLGLAAACAPAGAGRAAAERELRPGETARVTLDLDDAAFADFSVDLPDDAVTLEWRIVAERAELDLSTRRGEPVDEGDGGRDYRVSSDMGEAWIVYDRSTSPTIGRGTFHARVEWPYDTPPRASSGPRTRIAFAITASVARARIDGKLVPGTLQAGVLERASGDFRTYTIQVPPRTRVLRLDLAEAGGDLDLYARHGRPILAFGPDVSVAEHGFGRETLLVTGADGGDLASGTWFVDVVDPWRDERGVEFALLAGFDAAPSPALLAVPALAPALGPEPLGRALAAVVELSSDDSTGSGTIVSKDGWILTCAHVVEDIGGTPASDVVVALTIDARFSARELFRAEVVEHDHARDLALLRIRSGFFGEPLPPGLTLPWVEPEFGATPRIGDPLFLVGYPSTGGQGPRVSISATRGIVAGFEAVSFGVLWKTDAEITNGNSGGAALEERGRLIAIPSSTIENGAGQIGYLNPLAHVPASWRARIAPPSPK